MTSLVQRILAALVAGMIFTGGAAMASDNTTRAKEFFQRLDKDHLSLVDEFYDPDADFQDPIHHLRGAAAVKDYYAGLYKNVKSIRFEFPKAVAEVDTVVLVWRMFLETPSLNGGKEFFVDGTSVITFGGAKGKAVSHRDYFDMGEFVYERLPILKSVIGVIKRRLSSQ
jgi:ketosteroid isomerase-like protein